MNFALWSRSKSAVRVSAINAEIKNEVINRTPSVPRKTAMIAILL